MSLVNYDNVFFVEGKMKMITKKDVSLTSMEVKPGVIQFRGVTAQLGNIFKDSTGFYYEIQTSEISKVYKAKVKLAHCVVIEMRDGKMISLMRVTQGDMLAKKASLEMVETLSKILSSTSFCPKCGKPIMGDAPFCPDCGFKLK